jgi:hypothetical protein
MLRPEIAEHTGVCDLLIAAHTGDTYLTSGLVGDAVALGLTMLVPEWEYFREIMGPAALYHDNTLAGLTRALRELTPAQVQSAQAHSRALQDAYSPHRLAGQLLGIFQNLRLS